MRADCVAPRISFTAPQHVEAIVRSIGRTEDVRFSPDGRRLAVAGFAANKIAVFDVSIACSKVSKSITLTAAVEISSSSIQSPHGIDFVGDEHLLVANREGNVCVFKLPLGKTGSRDATPLAIIRSKDISTPGSAAVLRKGENLYDVLICNNFVNRITKHSLDLGKDCATNNTEILLEKWMDVPDSICVSKDKGWIAVSNHNTHSILLYKNDPALNAKSNPDGVLRNHYPHGLRFTSDLRFLLAASAGSPYVNVYETADSDWRGVRAPTLSLRVLSDVDFFRGRDGREEGGPKGIDIHDATKILVTTCEIRPLDFFDLASIEQNCVERNLQRKKSFRKKFWPNSLAVRYELYRARIKIFAIAVVRWMLWRIRPLSWMLNKARTLLNVSPVPKSY